MLAVVVVFLFLAVLVSVGVVVRGGGDGGSGFDDKAASGDLEDPDRKSRREAEMRLSGSVSGHRLGQEQA